PKQIVCRGVQRPPSNVLFSISHPPACAPRQPRAVRQRTSAARRCALRVFGTVQRVCFTRWTLHAPTCRRRQNNSNAGSSTVNTATRLSARDRARGLSTKATALHRRKGVRELGLESAAWAP